MPTDPRDRLIVALDFPDAAGALELVDRLGDEVHRYKIGLELFTAEGPPVVREVLSRGKGVFLDLKLHDIPNTVAGAVRSASHLGVDLLTLHVEGGPEMLRAAAAARDAAGRRLRLLGVTVLTSLTGAEFPQVYRDPDPARRVLAFARAAMEAGLDGVVASPVELPALRVALPDTFLKVIPGIRFAGAGVHDQARTATPAAALSAGATHLVVGRTITAAADRVEAARAVLVDMARA